MKALIIADLEGITDVYDLSDFSTCTQLYNEEINIYIDALVRNGITNIIVYDAHNDGKMINTNLIKLYNKGDVSIKIIQNIEDIPFDEKYDFAMLVGFHGKKNSKGILPHTLRFDFDKIFFRYNNNDIVVGEVELFTRWLGSKMIPVILTTGDREATSEANQFNPYQQTCCVKSLYQLKMIDKQLFYNKVSDNVDCALKLDFKQCISKDDKELFIEFVNNDVYDELCRMGYKCNDGYLIFKNCEDFIKDMYNIVYKLMDLNKLHFNENKQFLKELREMVKDINKENLINSKIGDLLNNDLTSLDSNSREKIRNAIAELKSTGNNNAVK